ncbi:UDP-glucose 6-dehydrogenase [endosymbiont of Riftia pachyptila (vent Ph05)]|nr:UDP-glucose 6-dehydrogenase [endosymbiont of Riftia pachyptila (vent Ph05)]
MRAASSRVMMESLWEAGASVRVYDPVAMEEAGRIYGERDELTFCESAQDALQGAEALIIMTEWTQFRSPDFDSIKETLGSPAVFDGRNMFEPETVTRAG